MPATEQTGDRLARQKGKASRCVLQAQQPMQAHVHALIACVSRLLCRRPCSVLADDLIGAHRTLLQAGVRTSMKHAYSDLSASHAYTPPATMAPMIGATQKSQSCPMAQPPTNTAGPVLRA